MISSKVRLLGSQGQTGASFLRVIPELPISSWGLLGSGGGLRVCQLLTLLGVGLVDGASTVIGCTRPRRAGTQSTAQGHSPLRVATLHVQMVHGTRGHFWVPGRSWRTRSWEQHVKGRETCRIELDWEDSKWNWSCLQASKGCHLEENRLVARHSCVVLGHQVLC